MIDAYAAKHGSVTLAVDAQRFLLEDSQANIVLSLHPALSPDIDRRPTPCNKVAGFSVAENAMRVDWEPVGGFQVSSQLCSIGPCRYELTLHVTNQAQTPNRFALAHPVYFAPDGPGACGLGFESLRTLGATQDDRSLRMRRLHGPQVVNPAFGLWFAESGRPMLLAASLRPDPEAMPHVTSSGARGKMLTLRLDDPAPDAALQPGASCQAGRWLLAFGDLDCLEELRKWAEIARQEGFRPQVPEFDPTGEPAPEPQDDEAEPDLPFDEPDEADEDDRGSASAQDPISEIEANYGKEPKKEVIRVAGGPRPGSCAWKRRAWRQTREFTQDERGFWPQWASGRKHPPIRSTSTRTRDRWQRPHDTNG